MANSKRLDMLLKMTAAPAADAFAFYALAMEYKSLGMSTEAFAAFRTLRERYPDYLPMYLACGTMLVAQGDRRDARDWLEAGLAIARQQANAHMANQIEASLELLQDA